MNRQAQRSTAVNDCGVPATVFDHLQTAAYHALGVETLDYATWMAEAEAAWITVAGSQR